MSVRQVAKAVMRISRRRSDHLTIRQGREARDQGRESQKVSNTAMSTYSTRKTCKRASSSKLMVPAALATRAKTPSGVNLAMNWVIRPMARLKASRLARRGPFVLDANERYPYRHTEDNHRRDKIVGHREKRVGRNEQGEEIDLFLLLDQGGTEKTPTPRWETPGASAG